MVDPRKAPKKKGRKGENVRTHISWPEDLLAAADVLGAKLFGNKSAYLAHIFVKEMERQGMTIKDILKLGEEKRHTDSGGSTGE